MTNIDTMPAGPEMDRLIAEKVMGWRLFNYETDEPAIDHLSSDGCAWRDAQGRDGFDGEAWKWAPSADIAHAWEVVEKMEDDHEWRIENDQGEQFPWLVEAMSLKDQSFGKLVSAEAEAAPLAICRAALKAVQP